MLRHFRRFPFTWWLVVTLIATTAGVIVWRSVDAAQTAAERYGGKTRVYVTTQAVRAGAVLDDTNTDATSWPRAFLPDSEVVTDPLGRVVTQDLPAGAPLVLASVSEADVGKVSALLQRNEQAVAVPTDDAVIPFEIGDHVSVLAAFDTESSAAQAVVLARLARVIGRTDSAVTVAVPADDAPALAAGLLRGKVVLALTRR